MNYRESLDYILRFADYERLPRSGIVWDLKRVVSLLERLGNPHLSARTVHVAGTKGKGSTAAMTAAILKAAGWRTGFFASPHLLSFTERIQVDGGNIPEDGWARLTESIKPHVAAENAGGAHGELTTFEILTAMAFLHFRNVGADFQVMEAGLGGRLDATNVVQPDVGVITSISYDHTDVLGETLAEIAGEKAGIIKPGVPVVTAPQPPAAMRVIDRVCKERHCRLVRVGADVIYRIDHFDMTGQSFYVKGRLAEYNLRIPLLGRHQVENAVNAVAAAEILAEQGFGITPENIRGGLFAVKWPGRLQVLRKNPWVVVDAAHNAYSVQKLGHALKAHFSYDKLTLVLGFGNDKDLAGMMDEAVRFADKVVIVASKHPRSVPAAELVREFRKRGLTPEAADSVPAAMKLALKNATPGDLICAAGSVFVIAEVMQGMG